MRIVGVADTHLFHEDLQFPEGDMLIHAGDMCRLGDLAELEEAAKWIASLPYKVKVVVAGNHDQLFEDEPLKAREAFKASGAIYLEDSGAEIEGLRFWGSPWQPEYNDWSFNLPRGKPLADKWALVPEGLDILVTHSPPAGIGDRGKIEGRQGCEDLRARVAVVKPKLHLFGHIHQDGGFWKIGETCFANVTTWECERQATVIDFDPRTGEITPVVVPEADTLR